MKKYIDGQINDFKFTSDEPFAIGIECSKRIPNSRESGFSAKIIDWAWKNLVGKNTIGNTFDENGVFMVIVEDEQNQVEEETVVEFSIASISTGKVVPRVFKTESEAEEYRAERSDPEKWKIVGRKIIYSPWE